MQGGISDHIEDIDNCRVYTYYYRNKYGSLIKHQKKYCPKKKINKYKEQRIVLKKMIDNDVPDHKLFKAIDLLKKL